MKGRFLPTLREAMASAIGHRVASLVTVLIVAGMCAVVVLTTGRTVAAENAVVASIDAVGSRTIVVRAASDAGLRSAALERMGLLDGVGWIGAFGPPVDVSSAAFRGGDRLPIRTMWVPDLGSLGLDETPSDARVAWASPRALARLGMEAAAGGVVDAGGVDYSILGALELPPHLAFLDPLVVAPQPTDDDGVVSVLVVVADRPEEVSAIATALIPLLDVDDSTQLSIETSTSIADLRAIVQGQLGEFGRQLVLLVFGVSAFLVCAMLSGLVMLRRKDFGRRRALGASQRLIIALVLGQTAVVAGIGAVSGVGAASTWLLLAGDPLPGVDFSVATGVMATAVATLAAVLPAVLAARRDPLRELRVP